MEEQRRQELQRTLEFEKEQKEIRITQEKKRVIEDQRRQELIRKAQEEADKARKEQRALEEAERLRMIKIRQDEESEAVRLQKIAMEESEKLLIKLREIEEQEMMRRKMKQLQKVNAESEMEKQRNFRLIELEAERIRDNRYQIITSTEYMPEQYNLVDRETSLVEESFNLQNGGDYQNLGITEEELDEQCEQLFENTPIEFRPRKNSTMDEMLSLYLKQLNVTVPVVNIKDSLYLIGSQRCNLVIKRDSLLVMKGGGTDKFENFIAQNVKSFQRNLVIYMIKTGESLEYVVDSLINNKKIRTSMESVRVSTSSPNRSLSKSPRSPGEKRYMQQKEQIMMDMKNAMKNNEQVYKEMLD